MEQKRDRKDGQIVMKLRVVMKSKDQSAATHTSAAAYKKLDRLFKRIYKDNAHGKRFTRRK